MKKSSFYAILFGLYSLIVIGMNYLSGVSGGNILAPAQVIFTLFYGAVITVITYVIKETGRGDSE